MKQFEFLLFIGKAGGARVNRTINLSKLCIFKMVDKAEVVNTCTHVIFDMDGLLLGW